MALIKRLDRWRPDNKAFLSPLSIHPPCVDALSSFPRGVDNVRIDVLLSQRFTGIATDWVRTLLQQRMSELHQWHGEPFGAAVDELQNQFRDAYIELQEFIVGRARNEASPGLLDLFHAAVFSFLFDLPMAEHERVRKRLTRMLGMGVSGTHEHALTLNERLVRLASHEWDIRYRLSQTIFRQVYKLESSRLRKVRKSALGRSWQIPRACLFNPLLQLPAFDADVEFMQHYLLCFSGEHGSDVFAALNALLLETFSGYLPSAVSLPTSEPAIVVDPKRFAYLPMMYSAEELAASEGCWLDEPDNFWLLCGLPDEASRQLPSMIRLYSSHWTDVRWPEYQKALKLKLLRGLAPLAPRLLAARETRKVCAELEKISPSLVYAYLSGQLGRKELLRRLDVASVAQPQRFIRRLDGVRRGMKRLSSSERSLRLLRGVAEFLSLRRDGKRALQFQRMRRGFRFLERPEEIELSRRNGVLRELVFEDEMRGQVDQIRSHVIIKADLRGSSAIIGRLVAAELNPATYFSLNFFTPITRLVEELGGEKVFVEGDAVILAVIEYEGPGSRRQSVAHASLLARKILGVVDRHNISNRKHGLPELEVGLGIAFSDSPPTYLYDGDKPIMISSAIHRSDRLSSCHSDVRKQLFSSRGRGIEVITPNRGRMEHKADGENLLRYNVNGVELDAPAFFKLKSELVLNRFEARDGKRDEPVWLHAGRFTDRTGGVHWLVVREARVRVWSENGELREDKQGRRFYEVVTDPDLLALAKRRMRQRKRESPEAVSGS